MKEIRLSQNKIALVDDSDYEELNKYNWYAHEGGSTFYAARTIRNSRLRNKQTIMMHQSVLQNNKDRIDHIDCNGLNNQKENLRIATNQQNCMNKPGAYDKTSIYKGVFKTRNGTFETQFKYNYKSYSIGRSRDEQEAAKYYDAVARYYHGEFAWCNFKEIFIKPDTIENIKKQMKEARTKIKTITGFEPKLNTIKEHES